ncbi:MAG: hypothetical protein ACOCZ8_02160, partial [Bacteroidota bacterium]
MASFFTAILFDAAAISKPLIRSVLDDYDLQHWPNDYPFALLWAPLHEKWEALFLIIDGFESDDDTFDAQLGFLTDSDTGLLPHFSSYLPESQPLWLIAAHRKGGHVQVSRFTRTGKEDRTNFGNTIVRVQQEGDTPEQMTMHKMTPAEGKAANSPAEQLLRADFQTLEPGI